MKLQKIWNQNDSLQIHFDQNSNKKFSASGKSYIQLPSFLEIPLRKKN